MKKRKVKVKYYDCDFYTYYGIIPYKTTRNMTWEQVKTAKKVAKVVGDRVVYTYSHTEEYEYS